MKIENAEQRHLYESSVMIRMGSPEHSRKSMGMPEQSFSMLSLKEDPTLGYSERTVLMSANRVMREASGTGAHNPLLSDGRRDKSKAELEIEIREIDKMHTGTFRSE